MEEKMKSEKASSAVVVPASASSSSSNHSRSRRFGRPSWLLCTIADLDKRMKMMASNIPEEDGADTFAQRAEAYYKKRPQLLNLLQDLYNSYLSLADRYCQSLGKSHSLRKFSSPISVALCFDNDHEEAEEENGGENNDSDAESSLSYQPPFVMPIQSKMDADNVVAELVIKAVDYEILVHELTSVDRIWNESSRKIELQKSLLDVLESERLVLLNENARLGYRVTALMEDNKGLASESLFMKRKASELARCVLKMREDHRVFMLSRKIEDLQGQIYGLEEKNKEYCEQILKQDGGKCNSNTMHGKSGDEVTLEDCVYVGGEEAGGSTATKTTLGQVVKGGGGGSRGRKFSNWWQRAKRFDLFLCVPDFNSTCR